MTRRIEPKRWRVGSSDGHDPDAIEELEQRRDKHARLIQGKPAKSFGQLLDERMRQGRPEEPEEEAPQEKGARDPLLGLDPNQDAAIANRPAGRRSGRVIVKG